MATIVEIAKDIYWVGVLDSELRVFDVIMDTVYGTTYNSYVVKTMTGFILIETVKEPFFDSYFHRLKKLVQDLSKIKFLIANHTEPDHAGSIARLLEEIPNLTVIASLTGLMYLNKITNMVFNQTPAEELGVLNTGDKSFKFISVPFLHWPDSMFTYMKEGNVLFTCDVFGAHYCPLNDIRMSRLSPDEEADYQAGLLEYYTDIFSPFKPYVIRGMEKIKGLQIDLICLGHGPVLDARVEETMEVYRKWSTVQAKPELPKTIVIPYCSAYGYSEEITNAIITGIKSYDSSIIIRAYRLNVKNYAGLKSKIINEILNADGVLFGSITVNGDALPFIWELALSLNPVTHAGKVVSVFGSYGWSGEGIDNIVERLYQVRLKVVDPFKVQFRASKSEIQAAQEFGSTFADYVQTGAVPETKRIQKEILQSHKSQTKIDYRQVNPSGQVVLWRCLVCGEIFSGVLPPLVCPICGVTQDMFELYVPDEKKVEQPVECFIIISQSYDGIAAAKAIREVEEKVNIMVVAKDRSYRQFLPMVSDSKMKMIHENEFFQTMPKFSPEQQIRYERESNFLKSQYVDEIDSQADSKSLTSYGSKRPLPKRKDLVETIGSSNRHKSLGAANPPKRSGNNLPKGRLFGTPSPASLTLLPKLKKARVFEDDSSSVSFQSDSSSPSKGSSKIKGKSSPSVHSSLSSTK